MRTLAKPAPANSGDRYHKLDSNNEINSHAYFHENVSQHNFSVNYASVIPLKEILSPG